MKTALCAIAKNEEPYIVDWVQYHIGKGFDTIIIGDNNEIGNDNQKNLLLSFINDGNLIYIDLRNQIGPQNIFYEDVYRLYKNNFDWIAFWDIDEFLMLSEHKTINALLGDKLYDNATTLFLNWKCYGDDNKLYYEQKPVYERFTIPYTNDIMDVNGNIINRHIKSIVKTTSDNIHYRHPHNAIHTDGENNAVNALGNKVNHKSPFQDIIHENAWLNHYCTLTLQEFIDRRFSRGQADSNGKPSHEYLMKFFFIFNKITLDKVNYIKSRCNNESLGITTE